MNHKERKELAKWAMKQALKNGADESAVTINNRREVEINYRDKQLDKLKESTQNGLSLTIYVDNKFSTQSTNDLRKSELEKFIADAVSTTKYLAKDEFRSLPDPKYYPNDQGNDLKIMDPDYEKVSPEKRMEIATAIEDAARSQSDKLISATAWYSDAHSKSVKVHSNGFAGETESTSFGVGGEATIDDGKGGRPDDYVFVSTRFIKDLPPVEALGKEAVQKALDKIGQSKMESGKYTMLVENRAVLRLLGMLAQPLSGQALQQKSSYLDGMQGKQIASTLLTVIDDPTVPKGLGSKHYDGEGLAAVKRPIIEDGILRNYYIDTYYAKKLNMEPTSGGTSNVVFKPGAKSKEALIESIDKGILITGFIGGNSNPTTGDFSYGIIGQYVEKGKIVKPVNEMNISGNGLDFWKQLVAVGNDPYIYSSWRAPSLMFDDVEFSGL